MGAFLSGLLGAAGKDIEKESERSYQEKRQERQERLRILDLAASNPNTKPDALPSIFAEMDDVAKDAGYKHPGKVKDPFTQMGKMVVGILHKRNQGQQQQQQQQQNRSDIQNAPGQTVSPQGGIATPPFLPNGQAGPQGPQGQARQLPPIPPSRFYTQAELDTRQQAKEGRASATEEAKEKRQHGYRMEEIEAKPKGQKFTPFHINGANIPEDTETDAYNNPIDREKGIYKMEETSGKFYPVNAGPKSAGGVGDQLTQWTKIILAKNPKLTPEQATQQAATELFKGKFVLPQQRLDAMKNTVRTIMGENALLQVPTHAGGPAPRAIQFPNAVQSAPMPAPSGPVQRGAGQVGQVGQSAQPAQPAQPWHPEVKGLERGRKTNSEVIMMQGGNAIATIGAMTQKHPDWFGPAAGRIQDLEKRVGTADPDIGRLKGAMESLTGFLPALHGFRSAGILKSWQDTLDNPLKNPQYTAQVIREVMKVAEETRNSILNRNVGPMSAAGAEQKAAGQNARPVNPY